MNPQNLSSQKADPLSSKKQNLGTHPLKAAPENSQNRIQPKPKGTAVEPLKTTQLQRKTIEKKQKGVPKSSINLTRQAHPPTHPKHQNASQSPAAKATQSSQLSPSKTTPSNQPSKELTDAEKRQRSRRQALDQQLRGLLKEHGFRQKKTVPSLEKMPFDPIEKQDFLRKRKLVMEYNRIVEQTNSARESGHQLKKSVLAYNDAKTPEERKKAYSELAQRYRAFCGLKEKWMKEAQAFERNQKKYNIFLIKKEIFQKSIHARNQGSSEAALHFMKVRNLERTQQFADFIQPIADKAKGQLKAKAEKKLIEYFPGIRDYLNGVKTAYTRLSAAAPQEGNMPHKTLIEIANADKAFASRLLPQVKEMLPQHRKILLRYVEKTLKQREALNGALVKWKEEDFPQNIARETLRYQTTVPPSVADWLELNGQTGRAVGDSLSSLRQLSKALKQQNTGTSFQSHQKQIKK